MWVKIGYKRWPLCPWRCCHGVDWWNTQPLWVRDDSPSLQGLSVSPNLHNNSGSFPHSLDHCKWDRGIVMNTLCHIFTFVTYYITHASWVWDFFGSHVLFVLNSVRSSILITPCKAPVGHTGTGKSVLFPDEEIKVQMGDLTSPNHRFPQEQSLFLNSDLLPPSLRPCPFINHQKESESES